MNALTFDRVSAHPALVRGRGTRRRLAWALLAFVAFGCRQIAGIGDRVESDCGAFSFAVPACGTCMQDRCCDAMTACAESTSCKSALACLARCALDDAACRLACEGRAPGNELNAVLDCRDASCATTCSDCGGLVDGYGADCDACAQKSCCEPLQKCANDPACAATASCTRSCTTPDCYVDCVSGPEAQGLFIGKSACVTLHCRDACKFGKSWSCVGKYAWPMSSVGGSFVYDLTVVDFAHNTPVVGVTVKACDFAVPGCASPNAVGTTDANGNVKLDVKIVDPYTGFVGFLDLSAKDYLPTEMFIAKPIIADEVRRLAYIKRGDFLASAGAANLEVDLQKHGFVGLFATDCYDVPAPNVVFEHSLKDATTVGFYLHGLLVDPKATETDASSLGGFVNVPQGTDHTTMRHDGELVGAFDVPVEIGKLSVVLYRPLPAR